MRNVIFTWFQSTSPQRFNYKGGKSYFTMENTDRHSLNQLIKMMIEGKGTDQNHVPPDRMQWEHSVTSVIFLHNLNLIIMKHQTNASWDTLYKITGLRSSKVSSSWNSRKNWGFSTGSFCYKEYYYYNWWNDYDVRVIWQ